MNMTTWIRWCFGGLLLVLAVVVGYGIGRQSSPGHVSVPLSTSGPVVPVPAADSDLEAVRAYLRENTNSGKWEEVRWWPARPEPSGDPDDPRWRDVTWWKPKQEPSMKRVCRLKYREHNGLGSVLHDKVFDIKNGKAIPEWNISVSGGHLSDKYLWETWYPDDP